MIMVFFLLFMIHDQLIIQLQFAFKTVIANYSEITGQEEHLHGQIGTPSRGKEYDITGKGTGNVVK